MSAVSGQKQVPTAKNLNKEKEEIGVGHNNDGNNVVDDCFDGNNEVNKNIDGTIKSHSGHLISPNGHSENQEINGNLNAPSFMELDGERSDSKVQIK